MLKTLRQIASVGIVSEPPPQADESLRIRDGLQDRIRAVLGRALCIRHVDAGSCNGCELEIHALNNPLYNLEGLGIRFVASPRHADLLLVTGPVSKHMEVALRRTYEATPDPKLVVAIGDCGCNGGIFGENYASRGAVSQVIPVDVVVPGCPPNPTRILQGILSAIARSAAAGTAADSPAGATGANSSARRHAYSRFTAPGISPSCPRHVDSQPFGSTRSPPLDRHGRPATFEVVGDERDEFLIGLTVNRRRPQTGEPGAAIDGFECRNAGIGLDLHLYKRDGRSLSSDPECHEPEVGAAGEKHSPETVPTDPASVPRARH